MQAVVLTHRDENKAICSTPRKYHPYCVHIPNMALVIQQEIADLGNELLGKLHNIMTQLVDSFMVGL